MKREAGIWRAGYDPGFGVRSVSPANPLARASRGEGAAQPSPRANDEVIAFGGHLRLCLIGCQASLEQDTLT